MATIYFATNRNPNNAQAPTDFGSGFSTTDLGDNYYHLKGDCYGYHLFCDQP